MAKTSPVCQGVLSRSTPLGRYSLIPGDTVAFGNCSDDAGRHARSADLFFWGAQRMSPFWPPAHVDDNVAAPLGYRLFLQLTNGAECACAVFWSIAKLVAHKIEFEFPELAHGLFPRFGRGG